MTKHPPKRALVTDICGPVGRRVAERLAGAGYAVAGVDGRGGALPPPDGIAPRGWPKTPGAFGRGLDGVSLVVVTDFATPGDNPAARAEQIAGLVARAGKTGVGRLVALNSAALYAPEALQAGMVDERGPFVSRRTEAPLARAAMALERAVAEAAGTTECVILRTLPALARDCPDAQALIREIWRTGRPPQGAGRLQGIDADELADIVLAATRVPAAAGQAMNVAGPVAVGVDSAVAEIRRLGTMLVDDTDTSIRVRPAYPQVAPVLATGKAAAVLGARPKKRIWVSFAEVLQELIRQDRAGGRLPPVRSSLPPALTAIEAGETPLAGQVAVITDAATPTNEHLTSLILRLGATVTVIARTEAEADALRRRFASFDKAGTLAVLTGDIALMRDVRAMAGALCAAHDRVDLLFNTVTRLHDERGETDEGNECTFAANLLGPFLLTNLLAGALQAAPRAGVVNVVSDVYADSPVDLQDLQGRIVYAPVPGLGRAHAGLVMCGFVLAELAAGSRVSVTTIAPRPVRTETWRLPPLLKGDEMIGAQEMQRRESIRNRTIMQMTSARDVANHIADLAVSAEAARRTGGFVGADGPAQPVEHVQNREIAAQLWNACRALAQLDD